MEMTRRTSLISLAELVAGTSTSMPDWRIGAVIMKMMRSTRTTSMNGTMLISESDVCVPLASCGMFLVAGGRAGRGKSGKRFFDLGGDFQGKGVQALAEIA